MLDYHVHPDYSIDAIGPMESYVEAAIKAGLTEICFTTHYDLVPERRLIDGFVKVNGQMRAVTDRWLTTYIDHIHHLNSLFHDAGIVIRVGLEVDYHPAIETAIKDMTEAYPFDYVLGAVHSLEGLSIAVPEDCRAFCQGKSADEVCKIYFRQLLLAVNSGLFDAMAHLDLYKRFSYPLYHNTIDTAHRPYWNEVCNAIAREDIAIEINTGNWRKGLSEPCPSRDFLEDLHAIGWDKITLGSDAHHPALIGCDISRAIQLAGDIGFSRILGFFKRQSYNYMLLNKTSGESI